MRYFIIRPFGNKEGIDFDAVETCLVRPALCAIATEKLKPLGGTTLEILKQGNIREDMFRMIVASDLVIADVSIHNANVFYELGIRHALRPQHTFLIRSETAHRYPFDLQTDRYFVYDPANLNCGVEELAQRLRATINSGGIDSPVFVLLPKLVPHGRGDLVKAPRDFKEVVERAKAEGHRGDLKLYAHEAQFFEWDEEGLRQIGEAQLALRAYRDAKETFERLLDRHPDDLKANHALATIYQRSAYTETPELKESLLVRSDQAIRRVIEATSDGDKFRVEAYALQASNEKSRWVDDLELVTPDKRVVAALQSPHLDRMLKLYLKASNTNLNDHYPMVNALAYVQVVLDLARNARDAWGDKFDNEVDAEQTIKNYETLKQRLTASAELALQMDSVMGAREGKPDSWLSSSRADFTLITTPKRWQRVKDAYINALRGANRFTLDAVRRNLSVFKLLGVFEPGVSEALDYIDKALAGFAKNEAQPDKIILCAGHMVDEEGRDPQRARFPRTAVAEARARQLIQDALKIEIGQRADTCLGIASVACGADVLFHEACAEFGVKSDLYLPFPRDRFQVTSVQRGGSQWVERYRALIAAPARIRVLQNDVSTPSWLADTRNYDVWQRNNLWMMFCALATEARELTLIALFNPEHDADGPGGTQHLLEIAGQWGFKCVHLDARELLQV